jgi:hypothetical protein
MSPDDVHGNEMDEPHDFDDDAADALIRGTGADVDPRLAETIGDMRAAYASTPPAVGAALAVLIGTPGSVAPLTARRFERMRSSIIAKVGAATAAVVAATGGLAVAGALPAPVQDAVSHIGVGRPAHDSADKQDKKTNADDEQRTKTTKDDGSSTSVPGSLTSPTTAHKDNHGGDVSSVAHDPNLEGCAHGKAVAAVASDGKSQGKPCPTTTTTAPGDNGQPGNGNSNENTPPTSVSHGQGQANGSDNGHGSSGGEQGKGQASDTHGGGGLTFPLPYRHPARTNDGAGRSRVRARSLGSGDARLHSRHRGPTGRRPRPARR